MKLTCKRYFSSELEVGFKKNRKELIKNYFKTSALIIVLGVVTLFAEQIQNALIKEYNKSVMFVQKYTDNSLTPLGV